MTLLVGLIQIGGLSAAATKGKLWFQTTEGEFVLTTCVVGASNAKKECRNPPSLGKRVRTWQVLKYPNGKTLIPPIPVRNVSEIGGEIFVFGARDTKSYVYPVKYSPRDSDFKVDWSAPQVFSGYLNPGINWGYVSEAFAMHRSEYDNRLAGILLYDNGWKEFSLPPHWKLPPTPDFISFHLKEDDVLQIMGGEGDTNYEIRLYFKTGVFKWVP